MEKIDKLNEVFVKYEKHLGRGFYNLLWQIMIHGERDVNAKETAFTPCVDGKGVFLGIADKNQKGYTPTGVEILLDYTRAFELCERLNEAVFNINPLQGMQIVASSMRNASRRSHQEV